MERTDTRTLAQRIGQIVRVCGFVQTIRKQKTVVFIVLRDRSGLAQIVIEDTAENAAIAAQARALTPESAVEVVGTVVENAAVKLGGLEIVPSDLVVHSFAERSLPITTSSALEHRMDWRFIDLRDPKNRLIFELQTTCEAAMRDWWLQHGFIEIHSPKLMATASEGGAELFQLPYFKLGNACLAQSPQFYKQMAMAAGFERVFEIGPVFRANPSFTSRHDTEFTSVDLEVSWVASHHDVMAAEEAWLQYVLSAVQSKHAQQLREVFGQEVIVPTLPFPRITMAEAHAILERLGHERPDNTRSGDLDPEGERKLGQWVQSEHGHEFLFVIDYPTSIRPFYHMRHADNPDLTKSFDLLWKGLEVTTGAQREHRLEILKAQAVEKGVSLEAIDSYLSFFRFGVPPHGGLGFGLTRMLMLLTGMQNVREVTYLYRGPNRLTP